MFGKKDKDNSSGGVSGFLGKLCSTGATDKNDEHNMDTTNITSANENVIRNENVSETAPLIDTSVHHNVVDSSDITRTHNPTVTAINETPGQFDVADRADVKSGNYEYDDKNKELRTYEKEYGRNKNDLGNYEHIPSGEVKESIKNTTFVNDRPLLNQREHITAVEPNLHSSNVPASNLHSSNVHSSNIPASNLHSSNVHSSNVHSSNVPESNLHSSNLHSSNLHSSNVPESNLHSSNVPASNLHSSNLNSSNVPESNLHSSNIHSSNVPASNLRSSELRSSNLPSSNVPVSNLNDDSNLIRHHNRDMDTSGVDKHLGSSNLYPTGTMGMVDGRDHVKEYVRDYDKDYFADGTRSDGRSNIPITRVNDSSNLPSSSSNLNRSGGSGSDLLESNLKIRDEHERQYELERNKLREEYEREFIKEKDLMKRKHEEELETELKAIHKMEYDKEKNQLKEEFERDLERRRKEIRDRHDQLYSKDIDSLKNNYDSKFEGELNRLKQKNFERFEEEKLRLQQKYKESYEKERNTIVNKFSNVVDKDKAELKSKHEGDLKTELGRLQNDFDKQFEMERERLKQQYESTFEKEKLGLKEDHAKMVIEDKEHQGINMKIHDNTTLPKQNIVSKLKEKIINLGGHDTFDIKGKDWYEGSTETYVKEGPTTTYSSSSTNNSSNLNSQQFQPQNHSEFNTNYSDSTVSRPITTGTDNDHLKNEHLNTSNVESSDRNKYVHHDA